MAQTLESTIHFDDILDARMEEYYSFFDRAIKNNLAVIFRHTLLRKFRVKWVTLEKYPCYSPDDSIRLFYPSLEIIGTVDGEDSDRVEISISGHEYRELDKTWKIPSEAALIIRYNGRGLYIGLQTPVENVLMYDTKDL